MGKRDAFYTLTVSAVDRLTDDAVKVSLEVPDEHRELFAFSPGQYLTLRTTIDTKDVRRAYSICTTPSDPHLSVGIRAVESGRFSGFANQTLRPGDQLQVMPPQGHFVVENPDTSVPQRVLAVAAGSGITPILSIVRSLLETTPTTLITLLYGNRWIRSIMFRDELDDLKDRYLDRFRLFHCLSRESQDIDLFNGRIDSKKISELAQGALIEPDACDRVLICGPTGLTDSVTTACVQLGIEKSLIKTERFTPADDVVVTTPSRAVETAVEHGVEVTVIIDGTERRFMHKDASQSLLDAAHAAGIELPFSCAGGMCATCRCKLIDGEGEMAVNYSLEPWELEAGFTLACQTRPKSESITIDFDAV